ncbi:MAG: hypothetical protein RLY72_2434 [Planctomycetota bacterium]
MCFFARERLLFARGPCLCPSSARAAILRHNVRMLLAAGDILGMDIVLLRMVVLAALGGALGSVVRDRVVSVLRTRAGRADLGVLAVNLAACVIVGLGAGFAGADPIAHFMVLGFAGGLSTWSSLAVEVAGEIRARRWARIALHVPGAFALALALFLAARALGGDHP